MFSIKLLWYNRDKKGSWIMKCILMNKNTEVLVAEYDEALAVFTKIEKIKNIEYAPIIIHTAFNLGEDVRTKLSEWFKDRGIPSWRDDLDLLLIKLELSTPTELLDKAFGLSLSDQYWVKPFDSSIKYEDINFFDHDFGYSEFTNATFSKSTTSNENISLISPNNTTDGRLKKAWIIENGTRYLLKSGYKSEVMQPFNEVLASMISKRLGFYYVNYDLDVVNNVVVSRCPCFINSNVELVPAYQILYKNCDKNNAYEDYIKILEDHAISDAREKIEDMFILDYLMLNEDRHLNNFGIIRDVNNLKWLGVAPIFDTGQSLNILDYNDDEIILNGDARFFYDVSNFDDIILKINNIGRYDLSKLDDLVDEFNSLLHSYSDITHMTDRRIDKICLLLQSRIDKLKSIIEKQC